MARCLAILLAFVLATGGSAASAKSVYKQFDALWEARQQEYQQQVEERTIVAKTKAEALAAAVGRQDTDYSTSVGEAMTASGDLADVTARYNFLLAFREHLRSKPLPEITQAWLQGRAARLEMDLSDLQQANAAISALNKNPAGVSVPELVRRNEDFIVRRSTILGEAAELTLVAQNAQSYFQASTTEKENRRSTWGAIFGGIASSMQQQQIQAQRNWTATCQRFGNRTQCFGN